MTHQFSFTVHRDKWIRGGRSDSQPTLLAKNGSKCCLGFYAQKIGLPNDSIRGEGYLAKALAYIEPGESKIAAKLRSFVYKQHGTYFDNDLQRSIVEVNDSDCITAMEREAKLKKLFAKANINIKFV